MVGTSHTWHAPAAEPVQTLSEFDRIVMGDRRECRVNIPIVNRYELRIVADMLRGLATTIDFESRRTDIPERHSLSLVQAECNRVNRIIRDHFRPVYEKLRIEPPKLGGRPRND